MSADVKTISISPKARSAFVSMAKSMKHALATADALMNDKANAPELRRDALRISTGLRTLLAGQHFAPAATQQEPSSEVTP